MIRCGRCCLQRWMIVANCIVNGFAVLMIIYSLWLLKKWYQGFADLGFVSPIPKPWFIYTSLGIGIVVCLSLIPGHMVANNLTSFALAAYIICLCSLMGIQAGVIVATFYKTDWESKIMRYIDEDHGKFSTFILFHLTMCRLSTALLVAAQMNGVLLAGILWFVGSEPRIHCLGDPPDCTYSFLADYNSPLLNEIHESIS